MNETGFREFTQRSSWIFAKTMPQNPHWYTLRKYCVDFEFIEAVQFIRLNGKVVYFRKIPYIQYEFEEFKYWTMGNPIHKTILINRAIADGI